MWFQVYIPARNLKPVVFLLMGKNCSARVASKFWIVCQKFLKKNQNIFLLQFQWKEKKKETIFSPTLSSLSFFVATFKLWRDFGSTISVGDFSADFSFVRLGFKWPRCLVLSQLALVLQHRYIHLKYSPISLLQKDANPTMVHNFKAVPCLQLSI